MTFFDGVLRVLGGALAAGAVGYAFVRFFTAGLHRAEKLAWSFATGLLVQAILFVVLSSILPGAGALAALAIDAAIVAASFLARRPLLPPRAAEPGNAGLAPRGRKRALAIALLAVAAVGWLVFLVAALSEPMWATDYLAMWGLKGKTIFETGFIPRRLFQDPALYWGRPDHPLLVPLSLATLASLSGGWHDQALALLFPLCELATILAVWGFLSRRVSPLAGATAAALTALCFPLYRAVNAGLAEIPLAFALVLASCAFFDALETGSRSAMTRVFLASLFAAWTKPEGTLFVLLLAGVLWVRKRTRLVETWKSGGWALVVPPVLHASLMFFLCRPQAPRDFDPTFFEPRRWSELLSRFGMVLARILGTEVLGAWIPVLAIGLFLLLTRRGLADSLLAVFALQILAYLAAFSISSFDPMWKVDSCFQRIAATLLPAFALVLGARVGGKATGQSVGTRVEMAASQIG
jgi:4-amino-4-deoxy-L-arabinose transferase-like glycosyltransferase